MLAPQTKLGRQDKQSFRNNVYKPPCGKKEVSQVVYLFVSHHQSSYLRKAHRTHSSKLCVDESKAVLSYRAPAPWTILFSRGPPTAHELEWTRRLEDWWVMSVHPHIHPDHPTLHWCPWTILTISSLPATGVSMGCEMWLAGWGMKNHEFLPSSWEKLY